MTGQPTSLGKEYEELNDELFENEGNWQIYCQLFGTNAERVNLLQELVPNFTDFLHWALLDSVVLGICRICDPAKTGKNDNLTLKCLVSVLQPTPNETQQAYLTAQLQKIEAATDVLRQHRNKRLAHADLERAKLKPAEVLPGISRKLVNDALVEIRALLNQINEWYLKCEVGYEHIHLTGDGETLLYYLRMGKRLHELQIDAYRLPPEQVVQKLIARVGVDATE